MSTSLSDISSGLTIYVSPSILVSQIYCASCFCCSLMTQIFMSPARYKGRDFRDKKFCKDMCISIFEFRIDIITIQSAGVSRAGLSESGGVYKRGRPSRSELSTRRAPYADDEIYLMFVHDALLPLGVFFQTALAPLPYFFSSLSSTSDLSTKYVWPLVS